MRAADCSPLKKLHPNPHPGASVALHLDLALGGLFPVVHLVLLLLEESPSLRLRHVLQHLVLVLRHREMKRAEEGYRFNNTYRYDAAVLIRSLKPTMTKRALPASKTKREDPGPTLVWFVHTVATAVPCLWYSVDTLIQGGLGVSTAVYARHVYDVLGVAGYHIREACALSYTRI